MTGPRSVNWYTIYDAQTDEIVACCTADMIVQQMGYASKNSFFSAITHTREHHNNKYIYHIEKVSRKELEKNAKEGLIMKITIETIGDNLSVNIKSPEGTSRADIASVMSLALASTVASVIPVDAPSAARMKAASSLADMIATAVKQNFLEVVTGKAGKAAVFTDKEAAFLSKLMGL